MSELAELSLIDKAVVIAIGAAKTFIGLFARQGSKLVLADFAVRIGISPFHELSETSRPITTWWRSFGLSAFLGGGEAGTQADEAEADDE